MREKEEWIIVRNGSNGKMEVDLRKMIVESENFADI
jgi:hypothetical protein